MIRNRIVHGDALVGSELEEFSTSSHIKKALQAFRTHFSRREFPPLPIFERGRPLDIKPVHVIFFGNVLYEFAREINDHVCSKMTDVEFIDMAFFFGALAEFHPYRTIRHRTAEARVTYFAGRYVLGDPVGNHAVVSRLKSQRITSGKEPTDLWRIACYRHRELSAIESKQ
jgi:hypothetical protein